MEVGLCWREIIVLTLHANLETINAFYALSFSCIGLSGLHLAAQFGHTSVAAYLIAKGIVSLCINICLYICNDISKVFSMF